MATPLQLLSLLLMLPSQPKNEAGLHPIVLVPGASCPNMKGKGWFELWVNAECFKEQMSLVFDPVVNDYRNLPGVPNFGSAEFHDKKPFRPELCLTGLREKLERIGYHDGETLFGAPYDLRHAFLRCLALRCLVEDASKKNKGEKVIIFGHSYGGMVALEFVNSKPLAWRNKYIKHLILIAPTLPQGFMEALRSLI